MARRRLAERRPDRAEDLKALLAETEAVVYGAGPDRGLRKKAAEEAKHWA